MRRLLLIAAAVGALASSVSWAQTSASPFTTGLRYDTARQLVGTIYPTAGSSGYSAVRTTYDFDGRVTKIERGSLSQWQPESVLPANWAGFTVLEVVDKTYDATGQQLTEKSSSSSGADPTLTQFGYDAARRPQCSAVRMNAAVYGSLPAACTLGTQGTQGPDRITRRAYDDAGRMVTEQRAYGTSLQQNYAAYAYTANGRIDWVEDANGNRSDFTYDGFDRLSKLNYPQASVGAHAASSSDYEQYGYDANSNRTSLRLRSTEVIQYQYDALNRVSVKDMPTSEDVYYGYNNQGLLVDARFGSLTGYGIRNEFDGVGRQTSSTSYAASGSLQLNYLSDEDGNRTRVTWPDSTYVQYTYDGMNRMDQVRENGAVSGPGVLADYAYDVLSRRTSVARGNGTTTAFYYDGVSRLSTLDQDLASTSRDLSLGFSYNNAGQVTQRSVSNDAYSYFSLTSSTNYTRDGLNRYQTVGAATLGYDGRGNLTSDGTRTFAYDLENHLLSVSGGATPVSLAYDPNGHLLTSASAGATTRYLYDGNRLVGEYNGSTLVRRYVHGPGTDEPVVWYEGAALTDRRWLHTDHQGSVVAISDGSGIGAVYAYGPYGEPAYDNWSGSRFRFTGQIMLAEAKLYHYKARVYDPVLGRFLQTDPVGYKDGLNVYAYVGNDPLGRADPTGTCGTHIHGNSAPNCKSYGTPQRTTSRGKDTGHADASVAQANKIIAEAEARGETWDSTHFNKKAKNATDGAIQSGKQADSIVNTTAPDGTKIHYVNETASPSQTVDDQVAKWANEAAAAPAGHKVIRNAQTIGELLGKGSAKSIPILSVFSGLLNLDRLQGLSGPEVWLQLGGFDPMDPEVRAAVGLPPAYY